jgi:hypothetical protein
MTRYLRSILIDLPILHSGCVHIAWYTYTMVCYHTVWALERGRRMPWERFVCHGGYIITHYYPFTCGAIYCPPSCFGRFLGYTIDVCLFLKDIARQFSETAVSFYNLQPQQCTNKSSTSVSLVSF